MTGIVKLNRLQLFWLTVFGVSMAFFESSIVVYLRTLYYPEGFSFPVKVVDTHVAITELVREFSSLLMIVSVAIIASKNFLQRFAGFLYIFAVWDIFYYVFLKVLLGWPESILTWDILFLLPVLWSGPVITPVIISFIMILYAQTVWYYNRLSGFRMYLETNEWLVLLAGAIVVFLSFIWDFMKFLFAEFESKVETLKDLINELRLIMRNYTPDRFSWLIFGIGVFLILLSISMIAARNQKLRDSS